MGPEPDPLPVRPRRRPHHADARHPRAALLRLLREVVRVRRRRTRPTQSRGAAEPHRRRIPLTARGVAEEYLDQEFRVVKDALPFEYDCEKIVDDFVLLCMLVENDFLPPLPTLDIAEGALNTLFKTYRDLLPSLGGYITGDRGRGTFVPRGLERILEVMGALEADVLAERAADVERREAKRAKFNKRGGKKPAGKDEMSVNDKFTAAMAALMRSGQDSQVLGSDPAAGTDSPASEPEGISADPTTDVRGETRAVFEEGGGGIEAWKEMYYREKLELKIGQPAPLAELEQAYFEGLNWVLQYYYRGVASWTWYYPFHYAPMASDLASGMGALTCDFDYGVPFRPFEQLLAVQPPHETRRCSGTLPMADDRAALPARGSSSRRTSRWTLRVSATTGKGWSSCRSWTSTS